MTYQNHGSFKFGTVDMYQRFGIMILDTGMPGDLFIPAIRSRKVKIPLRHGEYDYGAKYYDERPLTLNCITAEPFVIKDLRSYIREVTYTLSKKSEIRLWNEPDKYYVGRIYNEIQLSQLRDLANAFTLEFICEPFAYGNTYTKSFENRTFIPEYSGTASAPTYIVIRNSAASGNVTNIKITQIDKQENY